MTSCLLYASELALLLVNCLMNINEAVFAGKYHLAGILPGISTLVMISTWQKHQYQGEKCARRGIMHNIWHSSIVYIGNIDQRFR